MVTSTDKVIDKDTKELERLRGLQGKAPTLPYLLNVLIPGLGNILFGRVKAGIILIALSVIALLVALAGAATFQLGLLVTVISVVGALFTVGLSLILLPVGIFLMFFGGGGPIIAFLLYLAALLFAEYLVHKTAQQVALLPLVAPA